MSLHTRSPNVNNNKPKGQYLSLMEVRKDPTRSQLLTSLLAQFEDIPYEKLQTQQILVKEISVLFR
jgi:hypothetical protein